MKHLSVQSCFLKAVPALISVVVISFEMLARGMTMVVSIPSVYILELFDVLPLARSEAIALNFLYRDSGGAGIVAWLAAIRAFIVVMLSEGLQQMSTWS